jgi:hypothetical protein
VPGGVSPNGLIQNDSGLFQGFLPTVRGRLSLQQTTAWAVGQLMVIAGAEGPEAGEEAPCST